MDDIKLYGENDCQLESLVDIMKTLSDDKSKWVTKSSSSSSEGNTQNIEYYPGKWRGNQVIE